MCNLICKFCGNSFIWKNVQKQYCSNECKQNAKDSLVKEENENICVICDKTFISVKKGTKYCSNACNVKASEIRNIKEYSHECKNCKSTFTSNEKNTKFCSPVCVGLFKNKKGNGIIFKCRQCGIEFNQKHDRHYFCSQKCKTKYATENKKLDHVVNCSNCNKEIKKTKYGIKKSKYFFCCRECESSFRKKESDDIRICEFCKNEFECKRGEKLRFCSTICQNEWQKIALIGKDHPSYKHEITDEMRIKKCKTCGKDMIGTPRSFENKEYCSRSCAAKGMPISNTIPHLKTIEAIKDNGYECEIEKPFGRYLIDCVISENLFIEVMGSFWHCDHRVFPETVNEIQVKAIKKDRKKNRKITDFGIKILYIWEKDINENYEMCKKLIMEFIKDNGKLDNYHSMNYFIKNDELKLRTEILVPFFER